MMRFLILLEQTEAGFAIQVPDLAIGTIAETLEEAKIAAREAIQINLEAYREAGQPLPERQSAARHIENPDFQDHSFAYVEVPERKGVRAA